MAPLVTSAGVALVWPALAHNGLVITGAALIIACVLARRPSRAAVVAVAVATSAAGLLYALR